MQCGVEGVVENFYGSDGRTKRGAIVLSKRSTIWRKTSMRTLIRELRYIDVEEMRVVTNDKHIAEQIKTD